MCAAIFMAFSLDGPANRKANWGDSRELNRLNKKNYFHNVRAIRANRLKSAIRNFLVPRSANRARKGVQFGNPDAVRVNRANLRIDCRLLFGSDERTMVLWGGAPRGSPRGCREISDRYQISIPRRPLAGP